MNLKQSKKRRVHGTVWKEEKEGENNVVILESQKNPYL